MRSAVLAGVAALSYAFQGVAAQSSSAYTDPNTGIDFQRYYDPETGYNFGIALPETPSTDFIGQMVVPTNSSSGWGGVSFGGPMVGTLLLVAWVNDGEIVTSFRETSAYVTPEVYSGTATLAPIANGTFINDTAFSYTFLCSGCILTTSLTFAADATSGGIGYAISGTDPTDPTDASSALSYHSQGYGEYAMKFSEAYSADYATWASWAEASTSSSNSSTSTGSGSTSSGSNSTTTVPSNTTTTTSDSTYDVIVVGGGAAGLIVAERMAETGVSVLLLERGGASTASSGNTDYLNWNDTVTKFDLPAMGSNLLTSSNTSEFCTDTASTAGCLLGGSTEVNALNFIHPQEHDFDDSFPTGWQWADVSDAAARLYERNPGTTLPSMDGQRYDQAIYNITSGFLNGLGWSEVDSIASPNAKHLAYSQPAWSINDGKRAGPVETYLPDAMAMDNFELMLFTKVTNVIRTGSSVTGVLTVAADGSNQIINLNEGGKVILAAGALSSPRILFNSGIGPTDQLDIVQSGTTGVVLPDESDWINLPVGHNLRDHPQYVLSFTSSTNFTAFDWTTVETDPAMTNQELFAKGSGPLVQAGQRMHLWTSTNDTIDGVQRFFQGTVSAVADGTIRIKSFLTHGATSTGVLGITASGTTELVTKPWLQTDADYDAMQTYIQYLIDSASGNSTLVFQGSSNASDIMNTLVTGDHWMGTAQMGTDSGLEGGNAVVDLDTKVYGTDNLFVVDASIHPSLPTGNTQTMIMIVAEHAAEKIAAYTVTSSGTSTSSASTSGSSTLPSSSAVASSLPGGDDEECDV